jgi:hypothetical protein
MNTSWPSIALWAFVTALVEIFKWAGDSGNSLFEAMGGVRGDVGEAGLLHRSSSLLYSKLI